MGRKWYSIINCAVNRDVNDRSFENLGLRVLGVGKERKRRKGKNSSSRGIIRKVPGMVGRNCRTIGFEAVASNALSKSAVREHRRHLD